MDSWTSDPTPGGGGTITLKLSLSTFQIPPSTLNLRDPKKMTCSRFPHGVSSVDTLFHQALDLGKISRLAEDNHQFDPCLLSRQKTGKNSA